VNIAFALSALLVIGVAALGVTALVLLILLLVRSSSARVGGR
jgi:hypothetical protein